MYNAICPESVAGDPAAAGGIVEHPRHHEIEMQSGKQEHRRDICCERPPDMTAQERRVHPRPVHPAERVLGRLDMSRVCRRRARLAGTD